MSTASAVADTASAVADATLSKQLMALYSGVVVVRKAIVKLESETQKERNELLWGPLGVNVVSTATSHHCQLLFLQ